MPDAVSDRRVKRHPDRIKSARGSCLQPFVQAAHEAKHSPARIPLHVRGLVQADVLTPLDMWAVGVTLVREERPRGDQREVCRDLNAKPLACPEAHAAFPMLEAAAVDRDHDGEVVARYDRIALLKELERAVRGIDELTQLTSGPYLPLRSHPRPKPTFVWGGTLRPSTALIAATNALSAPSDIR